MISAPLPEADLDHVIACAGEALSALDGATVFITGGSGFIGSWIAESLLWARKKLGVDVGVSLLLRDRKGFLATYPHLAAEQSLSIFSGTLADANLEGARMTHVIHAAAPVFLAEDTIRLQEAFETIVAGTLRMLKVSAEHGTRRFLLVGSGAVYGRQPPNLARVPEDCPGGPDPMDPGSVYAEGKRAAELQCALAHRNGELETVVARGFAFVGPRLPLDGRFAVGNFLRDRLKGGPVHVNGDGTPIRSYLHAADAVIWLLTMLVHGKSGRAYNLGSDEPCTVLELAETIAALSRPAVSVVVAKEPVPGAVIDRYLPSIERAREELALRVRISQLDAIRRTFEWHIQTGMR